MKSLILCVDRDDDMGRKGGVQTPVVGRRRVLDAAIALGLADPEDSDTNALLSAVSLFDKENEAAADNPDAQVEVAAVAGHRIVGLRSDRELAREIDEVLQVTRADEVILVSDGAEDEQILPILTSRVPVIHIQRSIVKQAPRLEGFLYTMTRMMDDDKLAKRYLLPMGLVLMVWAFAFLFNLSNIATALTLGIVGGWLMTHAMGWEHRVTRFFQDFSEGLRSGRVSLVANVVMIAIFVVGAVQAADRAQGLHPTTYQWLTFADAFLFYLVSGLLVRVAGRLFDEVFRKGRASLGHWTFAFTLIAFAFIGGVLIDLGLALSEGTTLTQVVTFDLVVRLLVGLAVMAGGIVLGRYVKNFFQDEDELPARETH